MEGESRDQEHRWPLEARKGMEMNCPLELLEELSSPTIGYLDLDINLQHNLNIS